MNQFLSPNQILGIACSWLIAGCGWVHAATLSNGDLTVQFNTNGSLKDLAVQGRSYFLPGDPPIGWGFFSSETSFGKQNANMGYSDFATSSSGITGSSFVWQGSNGSLTTQITYSLVSSSTLRVVTEVRNDSPTQSIDYTYFHAGDPDVGFSASATFDTFNDVQPGMAGATYGSDWVEFRSSDPLAVFSFLEFALDVTSMPQLIYQVGNPYDPNNTLEDFGMMIAWQKTLAPGESTVHRFDIVVPSSAVVPEPASLALWSITLGAAGWRRWRRIPAKRCCG
ncbi:MAG: PEP-CTERM sorting domain-containing protein [Pirellulaceae bacterium]|jgi:hypothetical protein